MAYRDQFTKSEPMFNVLNTMHEWTEFEMDNEIQISPEVAEAAEYKVCCVVASAFIKMKNHEG